LQKARSQHKDACTKDTISCNYRCCYASDETSLSSCNSQVCCMWMIYCPFVLLASQSGVAGAYIDVDKARAEVLFVLLRSKTTTLSAAM
jgi:hypothetical protein